VIPHGVHKSNIRIEHKEEPVKNIAFVGAIFPHKGSELLEGMVRAVKTSDNIKIHLFGMTTANVEKGKCFINHGKYNRKDLPLLLKDNNIDLLCAFSLAPETFAYTVEEVVSAGVPVLSFNIGAAAERVKQHKLGWVVDYTDNPRTMISVIKDIFSNTTEYNRILSSVNKYETRGVEVMSKDYGLIYAKNAESLKLDKEYLKNKMITDDMVTIASRMNNGYMNEYFDIINSAKWRVVSKIKVPVKAKRIIKKIYRRVRK
jgi:glycosyltransferase involved in cell wall biosynthesis